MDNDVRFLRETFKLAKKGLSWTNPNPLVGAVIVKEGRIIGKGFHRKVGSVHGEIEALRNCKEDPSGATLYVNLEPCSCFGRTSPCVNTIIQSGIKKIVCSTLDPNQKVNGKGKKLLEKAGIQIVVGTLKKEARLLNEAFFTFHEKGRPFVAIKFAASLDGKMATATGDSKWITNEKARIYGRNLRANYQAILVGINTVLADNPNLGIRTKNKKDPVRIILGSKRHILKNFQVLRDQNVLIINPKNIHDLLAILREKNIISVLVEGGGETLGSFVDSKIIDKVYAFHAPLIIGGKKAITIGGDGIHIIQKALRLKNISHKKFGDNLLTIGYPLGIV
ncbi:bifunctional diaminohydroxyphosphoribosylaminopyrimidine deaminase/5-amino-6-(5-phosphoribosylamino)uracil reductase RibD [Candidatus Daviesbacteria bacterium]|nr:bifunctional diaminohydroxyphosphoribosylaminopyrimidine deaminase/5-amino-6-(5-phosphoribosylamino)uracil reductase RibD [Candidatus Daviesbacteria bacterium]